MSTSTAAAATSSSSAPASESSSSPRNTASRPGRDQKQQQQGQKKQQGQNRPKHNQSNNSGSNIGSSATDNNNNNSSSSRNRNRPGSDSPTVQLSKALSWLLRHNAESQGIAIRADGFCLLSDVMAHSKFKKFTVADVMAVVETNDKKRFEVMEEKIKGKDGDVTKNTFIRAVQGHSIKAVEDLGLEPLTDPAMIPTVVHGTLFSKWDLIRQHGLSKMNRNHIHMAAGLLGESGVISGMRKSCNLYIYIDTAKAIQGGIKFSRTSNGVILSDGLNGDGIIPAQYFLKVMKSSGEQVYPTP
ncbi:hypothetical protein CPC16_006647 [Podila verticillata]|nr:hypothetical protein BGZ52_004239 [Haplosporangium bisporale]KAF9210896.1 hypothetical protein BGZ59_008793 [Podila verticillata]KAF9388167.1 hypothetical protein CPC16_006647 [Podila verticillata]KFH66904.1 hypothetical protein MVEG_07429 [Podila verticillata NRRL 6337]